MDLSKEELERYDEICKIALNYARYDKRNELYMMIDAGFDPNFKDHKGNTLLMLATYNNSYETAKMLLENGAKVDEKNDRGQTPLSGVCFKGYFDIVKLLIENGAKVDESTGLGTTAYTFAVMFGHKDIADYLLKRSNKKSFLKNISLKILGFFKK